MNLQVSPDTVSITAPAAEAVQDFLKERELVDHGLRVYVSGVG